MSRKRKVNRILHLRSIKPKPEKIIKTRLAGLSGSDNAQTYNETIEYLDRITTSLNDAVMKVRMVPVEMVFNRFPRMIRDIARDGY